jgi:SNARE protein
VDELAGEVKWAKSEHERNGLFGPRPGGDARAAGAGGPLGNAEYLGKAVEVQRKTEQSLLSTAKMVEQSKEVAAATGEQLREQRQQIVQITDEVMRMEDSLTRADKLIRTFARRMATDRVILLATLLVFLGIAAIVVYKSVNPSDSTFYVPDEVTPPNPVSLYNATAAAINSTLSS